MCRLIALRANQETDAVCSLVEGPNSLLQQSIRDSTCGQDHPDGWGIARYVDGKPWVEKDVRSADSEKGGPFSDAAREARSTTIVAHVRKASVGDKGKYENTHPFTAGRWVFCHNGTVKDENLRGEIKTEIASDLRDAIKGDTDSERIFYWLLGKYRSSDGDLAQPVADVPGFARIVGEAMGELARRCVEAAPNGNHGLNVVLTDGEALVVTRWRRSLYWLLREGTTDAHSCGQLPEEGRARDFRDFRSVIIASEPTTNGEPWEEVKQGDVVWVDSELRAGVLKGCFSVR